MVPSNENTPEFFDGEVVKWVDVPGMSIGEVHYSAGFTRSKHTHERACFHFLFEGGYTEYLGRRAQECKTLTLSFQPQGYEHSYCCFKEPPRSFTIELQDSWVANLSDYSVKLDEA